MSRMTLRELSAWVAVVALGLAFTIQGCHDSREIARLKAQNGNLIKYNAALVGAHNALETVARKYQADVENLNGQIKTMGQGAPTAASSEPLQPR